MTNTTYVLATTDAATMLALSAAYRSVSGEHIVLLIPFLAPYGRSLEPTAEERAALLDRYRRLGAVRPGTELRVCGCRERQHVPSRLLLANATIYVGGARGRWRTTDEERIVRELTADGHRVTFVDVNAPFDEEPVFHGHAANART